MKYQRLKEIRIIFHNINGILGDQNNKIWLEMRNNIYWVYYSIDMDI